VVAAFRGGETVLANLEPICRMCNNDMGIENLEDFKLEWHAEAGGGAPGKKGGC
jgi:5-methylcytosine-specific restriction endonuclease McrA